VTSARGGSHFRRSYLWCLGFSDFKAVGSFQFMPDFAQEFFNFAPTIYLNCAYQGPFPCVTAERIRQAIELKCNPARMESHHFFDVTENVRKRLAELVGADPSEIALTNSATQGIAIVANGLGLKAGDEVVIGSGNFPSNLFTWLNLRRRGVHVQIVKPVDGYLRVEDVAAALTPRTRVLALDWVSYTTGVRVDLTALGELAHHQGSLFLVDGTQGVGALGVDAHALPVDILSVAGYKWLLGPYGTGFVYMSPEVQHRLDLQVVNWLTVEGSGDFDSLPIDQFALPKTARVFDVPATANFLNLYGFEASLEFIQRAGVQTVTAHCTRLLDRLAEGVRRPGFRLSAAAVPERRSTILCFQADSSEATERMYKKLEVNQVAVSLRHGMIRVSPYLYNTESDIDRLLEIIK
jgi:cysteine desulfurase / selenocysteine lyase